MACNWVVHCTHEVEPFRWELQKEMLFYTNLKKRPLLSPTLRTETMHSYTRALPPSVSSRTHSFFLMENREIAIRLRQNFN